MMLCITPPLGHGEDDPEQAPSAALARYFNLSAVILHDPVGNRQPQPGSARPGGEKRVEYLFQVFRGDPFAGVFDADFVETSVEF